MLDISKFKLSLHNHSKEKVKSKLDLTETDVNITFFSKCKTGNKTFDQRFGANLKKPIFC